jgi:hypothetical protein
LKLTGKLSSSLWEAKAPFPATSLLFCTCGQKVRLQGDAKQFAVLACRQPIQMRLVALVLRALSNRAGR